ncbi:MAG: A/G-specific adenine glycosylase [Legionella sp.]|nr:MAG: A/G-specific adenine glycosylase [Legionella sp.]
MITHPTAEFSQLLLAWFDQHGRKNLPWQSPRTAYRVWISEIMLQQTQVQTVIPYFNRFMQQLPTLNDLAQADEDTVLSLWSGLGYYSRARNLHKTAQMIQQQYQGRFPETLPLLTQLPGIGPSTAAAILSQAYNQPTAILDGNVKRVLTRFFRIAGWPEQAHIKKILWQLAQECMPDERCADYTQAIMDLGATCCTLKKPACLQCPLQAHCQAFLWQEQSLYPTKKIKKPVPIQQHNLLVLQQGHRIYLEKKPATGIWGGLWCLPSLTRNEDIQDAVLKTYQLKGEAPTFVLSFIHKLTHLHLDLHAFHMTITPPAPPEKASARWFSPQELQHIGLAKPTMHILRQCFAKTNSLACATIDI